MALQGHRAGQGDGRIIAIVPEEMFAASPGKLELVAPTGDQVVYRWSSDYPITTYNVSFAISDYASWTEDYISPQGDAFPLEFHVFPEHESIARYEFERVGQMIDFFWELYGAYAFEDEKYGMAEVVLAGAMEHQTMTSYGDFFMTGDRYYEGIVAHELSHHWWGNLLTLTDWNDLWLHEGLATFSDGLWREHIDGRAAYLQFLRQRSAGCCGFYGPISPPAKLFNQTVYQKGAWMLHMLREYVGDTDFFAALQSLTSDAGPALRPFRPAGLHRCLRGPDRAGPRLVLRPVAASGGSTGNRGGVEDRKGRRRHPLRSHPRRPGPGR